MQIVGMIGGIIVAKYVVGVEDIMSTFPFAMVGWFAGLLLGSGEGDGQAQNSE